jgi:hypothetical protein
MLPQARFCIGRVCPEAPMAIPSFDVSIAFAMAEVFTSAELEGARDRLIAKAKAAGKAGE